jgi:DNA-directed RNA polymerase subunit E'/Rpb7
MFYLAEVEDYVRVEPKLFGLPTVEAVDQQLREIYANHYDKELGRSVAVIEVMKLEKELLYLETEQPIIIQDLNYLSGNLNYKN